MKKYYFLLLFYIGLSHHWREIEGAKRSSESDDGGGGAEGGGGSEDDGAPYVEWCEDAGERRRVTADKCQVFPFAYPYPLCYCLSGIGVLRIESETGTVQEVQFSKKGCFSHKAIGLHNRTIVLHPFQFTQSDTVVGILGQDDNWEFHKIEEAGDPLPAKNEGTIVIYNGQLIDTNEDHEEGGALYCIQRNIDPELHQLVRQYKLGPDPIWILLNETCDGGNYIGDLDLVSSSNISTPENQMCKPICPSKINNVDKSNRARAPEGMAEDGGDESYNQRKDCKPIPSDLKAKHKDLNERILKFSIERSFYDQQAYRKKFEPARSFKILDLLAKITTKYCRNAQIPHNFLEQALAYFKIAHEGQNGFEFSEFFSNENLFTIQRMLRRCLWALESPFYMSKGCESPEILKTYANESDPAVATPIRPTVNHQYFDHHVVLDIPWNMLDLANTVCVKGFAASYRMYHEMEQGIEQLFTPQLRKFWLYPDVSTYYYEHIFGPHWMTLARNLEKCVETAYMHQPKMSRLHRPAWISGLRQSSRHSGTIVEPICTRRRIDIPLVSDNYEIYCEKPLGGGSGSGSGSGSGGEGSGQDGTEDGGAGNGGMGSSQRGENGGLGPGESASVDENALPGQNMMMSGQSAAAGDGVVSSLDLTNDENENGSPGGAKSPQENVDEENELGQGQDQKAGSDEGELLDFPDYFKKGVDLAPDSDSEYVSIDWPQSGSSSSGSGSGSGGRETGSTFIDWPQSKASVGQSGSTFIDWPQKGTSVGQSESTLIDWPQNGGNVGKSGSTLIDWPQNGGNVGKSGSTFIDWPQNGGNGEAQSGSTGNSGSGSGPGPEGQDGGPSSGKGDDGDYVSIDWPPNGRGEQGQGQGQNQNQGQSPSNGEEGEEAGGSSKYIKLDWRRPGRIDSPGQSYPSGGVFIDWASSPSASGAGVEGNDVDIGPGTISSEQDTFIDWPSGSTANGETEMPVDPEQISEGPPDEPGQRDTLIDWPSEPLQELPDEDQNPPPFTPPGFATTKNTDVSLDWPSTGMSSGSLIGSNVPQTLTKQPVELDWPQRKDQDQGGLQSSGEMRDVLLDWPQNNNAQYDPTQQILESDRTYLDWPQTHKPGEANRVPGKDVYIDWASPASGGGQAGNDDDVVLDAPPVTQPKWIKLDWKRKKGASSTPPGSSASGPEKELFNGESLDWPEIPTGESANVKLDWVPKAGRSQKQQRGRGTNLNGYITKDYPRRKEIEPEPEPTLPVDYSPAKRGRTATTADQPSSVESNDLDLDLPTTLGNTSPLDSATESVIPYIDFPTTYSETNTNFKRQKQNEPKPKPNGRTAHLINNDRSKDIPMLTWASKHEKYRPQSDATSGAGTGTGMVVQSDIAVNNLDDTTPNEDDGVLLDFPEKAPQSASVNSKGDTSIDWPGSKPSPNVNNGVASGENADDAELLDFPAQQELSAETSIDWPETPASPAKTTVLPQGNENGTPPSSSSANKAAAQQTQQQSSGAGQTGAGSEEVFIDWPSGTGNKENGAETGKTDGGEYEDGALIDFPPDGTAQEKVDTPSSGNVIETQGDTEAEYSDSVLIDFPADETGPGPSTKGAKNGESFIKLDWKSHSKPKISKGNVDIDWPQNANVNAKKQGGDSDESGDLIDFPENQQNNNNNNNNQPSIPMQSQQAGAEEGELIDFPDYFKKGENPTQDSDSEYINIDFPPDKNDNNNGSPGQDQKTESGEDELIDFPEDMKKEALEQPELAPGNPAQASDSDYINIDFPPDKNNNKNNNNKNSAGTTTPSDIHLDWRQKPSTPTSTSEEVYLDWMKSQSQNPSLPASSESYIKIDWPPKNIKLSWKPKSPAPQAGRSATTKQKSGKTVKQQQPRPSSRSVGGGGTADSTFLYQEGKGPASSRTQRKNKNNPDSVKTSGNDRQVDLEYANPQENLVSEDELNERPSQTRVNIPSVSMEDIQENQILPDEPFSNYEPPQPEIRLPILPDPKSRVQTQKVNYDDGGYSTPLAPAPSPPTAGRTFGYPVFPETASIIESYPANGSSSDGKRRCPSSHQFAVDRNPTSNCRTFWTCVPGGNKGSGLVLVLQCPTNTYFDLNVHDCIPGVCPGEVKNSGRGHKQNPVATEKHYNNNNKNNNNKVNVNDNSYNSTHRVSTRKVASDPSSKVTQPHPHPEKNRNRGNGQGRTNRNKIGSHENNPNPNSSADKMAGGREKETKVEKPKRLRTSSAIKLGVECKKSGEMWKIDCSKFYSCVNIYGQWFVNTLRCPSSSHFDPSVPGGCKIGSCTST